MSRTNAKQIIPVLIKVPLAEWLGSSHVSKPEGSVFQSRQDHAVKIFFKSHHYLRILMLCSLQWLESELV